MGSTAAPHKHNTRLRNYISWFEIPVYDITRAATFYNAIYGFEMEVTVSGEFAMAYFPAENGVGGALIAGPGCFPSDIGALIYLNAGDRLEEVLDRVELAGGRVIMTKTLISDSAGYFALFIDSEGNRLALHEDAPQRSAAPKAVKKDASKATAKKVVAKKTAAKRPK